MNTTVTTQCFFLATNLEKTSGTSIANILTSILNSIFSSITCVGNYIVLRAIFKAADLHSPSFVLLSCLAIADFFVGLICQPFFVAYKVAEHMENFGAYCTLRMFQSISSWITSGVSLLTLAAVSVDRLLTLTLHLRYCSSRIKNSSRTLDLVHNDCHATVLGKHRVVIFSGGSLASNISRHNLVYL